MTNQERRISIMDAFLGAFPADSSEVSIISGKAGTRFEVDWLDPQRDSYGPRTFEVFQAETGGYTFKEC